MHWLIIINCFLDADSDDRFSLTHGGEDNYGMSLFFMPFFVTKNTQVVESLNKINSLFYIL